MRLTGVFYNCSAVFSPQPVFYTDWLKFLEKAKGDVEGLIKG